VPLAHIGEPLRSVPRSFAQIGEPPLCSRQFDTSHLQFELSHFAAVFLIF
jgi:hypothetical protein